jgi:beta-lactamase class A
MISRRDFTVGTCAALTTAGMSERAFASPEALSGAFARIEAESGGRLGVAALNMADGSRAGHSADERFAMCSTFKLLASAAVLARVDAGKERLNRRVTYAKSDLVTYSPITEKHLDTGMTLGELCEAAITLSDNTAGNLLLAALGGPDGVTTFARALGDTMTHLDRNEPTVNEATPGDPRDTTTPAAMLANIRALVLGDALSPPSRDQLKAWMLANKTGGGRLRAGLPGDWAVGDKTGSGEYGTTNDVGVIWPPGRAPIVVTIYFTETEAALEQRIAVLASVGRAIAQEFKS